MNYIFPLFFVVGVLGTLEPDEDKSKNMRKTALLARANNAFGVDLYRILSAEDGNIFFSPFSISISLAMLLYGSTGESAEELKSALGFKQIGLTDDAIFDSIKSLIRLYSQDPSDDYQLYVANALLADKRYPIENKYKDDIADIFQALVTDASFENSKEIVGQVNEWVSRMTNNQIPKLLKDLDPQTVLLLLNAVYFKGKWQTQFKSEFTRMSPFFNNGSKSNKVKVPMMFLTEKFRYARLGDMSVLELPYAGGNISMVLLISEYISGLPDLEREMSLNTLSHVRRLMRPTEVTLLLPRFQMGYKKVLNDPLKEIGVKGVFGAHADLTGISKTGELVVSQVLHKAAIDVNEEGTEASGSTAVVVQTRTAGSHIYVRADHPFVFAIVDTRNDLILFQGRVSEL